MLLEMVAPPGPKTVGSIGTQPGWVVTHSPQPEADLCERLVRLRLQRPVESNDVPGWCQGISIGITAKTARVVSGHLYWNHC